MDDSDGKRFRYCRNQRDYGACNWLLPEGEHKPYCISCRLNRTVPDLSGAENIGRWIKLEEAKRHLLYSLLSLGLALTPANNRGVNLAFAFLEDARTNPDMAESFIATGHKSGLITINLAEADDLYRERVREELGEHYRTILGHFRHEIGHYYYEILVADSQWRESFETLFGDPQTDYGEALNRYYALSPSADWHKAYISNYAQAHPLEDWAETWAHYLHIVDTLETATTFGLISRDAEPGDMDAILSEWLELSVGLNALNRSMGLADAYPFVITPAVRDKLNLVHRVIRNLTS